MLWCSICLWESMALAVKILSIICSTMFGQMSSKRPLMLSKLWWGPLRVCGWQLDPAACCSIACRYIFTFPALNLHTLQKGFSLTCKDLKAQCFFSPSIGFVPSCSQSAWCVLEDLQLHLHRLPGCTNCTLSSCLQWWEELIRSLWAGVLPVNITTLTCALSLLLYLGLIHGW